jgi:hypothetical protein
MCYLVHSFILFLLIAANLVAFNCAKKDIAGVDDSGHGETSKGVVINTPAEQISRIKLDREFGECFGLCPVYTVSVFDDGRVEFNGVKNVKEVGVYSSRINLDELNKLVDAFREAGFMRLSDQYVREDNCSKVVLSDGAYARLTFKDGDVTKSVLHYDGCRDEPVFDTLIRLARLVDKTVNIDQWVGK